MKREKFSSRFKNLGGGRPWASLKTGDKPRYWLTRFIFLRALSFIYLIAFLVAARQFRPLIGADGLLPARLYLDRIVSAAGHGASAFWAAPSLFWIDGSDPFMSIIAWCGVALAALSLCGISNALIFASLWIFYSSFVNVGQIFYGYGWEDMLLEAGFLTIFLCPVTSFHDFDPDTPPPIPVFWMLRWMLFRVMFGAGLIKLRGDSCWRDLTCMQYHYLTQPIPNPLSFYFQKLPHAVNRAGVLLTHFIEILAPWGVFGPQILRYGCGAAMIAFQIMLILSGNLSFLNYLTIAISIPCFDDSAFEWLLPPFLNKRLDQLNRSSQTSPLRRGVIYALTAVIAILSAPPALNLLSPSQAMNASFEPFHIVNTYGAFGSILKERNEIVIEGTNEPAPTPATRWQEYEFKCKPGDIHRRPCVISPYHSRIDWQMWFAAMEDYSQNPWLIHLVAKLLEGDRGASSLLAHNPFSGAPPKFIRLQFYNYEFTDANDPGGNWWQRRLLGAYLPPLSLDNPSLKQYMQANSWKD